MDTFKIENAPWWLPHSIVVMREDYTAADESWVQARMMKIGVQRDGQNATPDIQMGKERGVLQVERMVQAGSVVAVLRSAGRTKTVHLPQEAEQLLLPDLNYIIQQIDALNQVIMPEDQANFLPSANEHVAEHLQKVK